MRIVRIRRLSKQLVLLLGLIVVAYSWTLIGSVRSWWEMRPGWDQVNTMSVVDSPRRQLRDFDASTATKATLVRKNVKCPMYCTGSGENTYFVSPLPGSHTLQIVDRIEIYCYSLSPYPGKNNGNTPVTDNPEEYAKDDLVTTERRSIYMDIPYGVYWIEISPCSPIEDWSGISPAATIHGPYRIAHPLNLRCPNYGKGFWSGQVHPCRDYSRTLGTYDPSEYDCSKDKRPIIYGDVRQALIDRQAVCWFDDGVDDAWSLTPPVKPSDVEQLINLRVLNISRYYIRPSDSIDTSTMPHLRENIVD